MLSVYNYEEPISFISQYIDYQKIDNKEFSIKKWSREIGLNSTAPLLDVLQGKKKLRGKLLEIITKSLPIDDSERMYFQAICEKSLASNSDQILMYDLLIEELKPVRNEMYSCFRGVNVDLYSHWIYMAILSMASLDNFEFTIENIKNKFREKFEQRQIEESLFVLFSNGLLLKNEDGTVERKYTSHSNKTNTKIVDLEKYFSMICDFAKNAAKIASQERELQCFSFAMSKDKLPLAKEILRKARAQIDSLAEGPEKDTIYQANLILFPLTK